MNKKIALLSAAASIALLAQPATAANHTAGFTTPGTMSVDTGGTGTWALTNGVEWTATNIVNKRLYKNDSTVLKGHKYLVSVTVPVWTQGVLSLAIGAPKHAVLGGDVFVTAGSAGLAPIADNFNTSLGLATYDPATLPANDSADPNGAFRFVAGPAKFAQDDPMLFPGLPGASHLHMFVCNTGVNANSTYQSLRASGGTSCGDPRHPVNRSAYWMPAMINGHGSAVKPAYVNTYYKAIPNTSDVCGDPALPGKLGFCVTIPNGLRYVAGWNSTTMTNEQTAYRFECHQELHTDDRATEAPDTYTSIDDMVDAGCPAGSIVYELLEGPICWDGQRVDSANHRDHVHYPTPADGQVNISYTTTNGDGSVTAKGPTPIAKCPLSHPYQIPSFSMQVYWSTKGDPTFRQKKWHLSSDEQMSPQMKAGLTAHMDYWEAWSPPVKAAWTQHCNNEHRSCAGGFLGDGTYIYTSKFTSPQVGGTALVSRTRLGWTEPMMGSGTFTAEVTAIDPGQIYLTSFDGFTGKVSAVSVTDITPGTNHAPVTVHVSH